MQKVFWDNPYQQELITTVSAVQGAAHNEILFNETIIFSFCGGQESDKATINGMPVLNSRMDGTLIYYTLPEGHGLNVSDTVIQRILIGPAEID